MDTNSHDSVIARRTDSTVRPFVRPFDPTSTDAESRYDAVVRRVIRTRASKQRLTRELATLTEQFVEDDLCVRSGPRRGLPLTAVGRRRRLRQLIDVGVELRRVEDEEQFATADLDRMNAALDRWTRENWGG